MTTSTHLRQVASRTGLDSIAEALREGANTIEQHEATIARRDAVIKLLEGDAAAAHEARRAAQAQLEDFKAALTKAEHTIERLQAGEWISVDERIPRIDLDTSYLGINSNGYICTFNALTGAKCPNTGRVTWYCEMETAEESTRQMSGLTHWMPLPAAPLPAIDAARKDTK